MLSGRMISLYGSNAASPSMTSNGRFSSCNICAAPSSLALLRLARGSKYSLARMAISDTCRAPSR
jgi:hypothetical protein